nr:immunoglobulin heavy chain junction region [Macaca mulatta]MOY19811.1 immunoglobulin heavy chain junction region [Macaca mulatta]MOY20469.1 immunoglobulin heavy chain junction region [Macaca mulatta]
CVRQRPEYCSAIYCSGGAGNFDFW